MKTLYEHAGKEDGLRRTISVWYASVLQDPVLHPLFGEGRPTHVDHLTAFFAEVFGGPTRFTDELGGFPALLAAHRGRQITEEQRGRFIELFLKAAAETDLPTDEPFRRALTSYWQGLQAPFAFSATLGLLAVALWWLSTRPGPEPLIPSTG